MGDDLCPTFYPIVTRIFIFRSIASQLNEAQNVAHNDFLSHIFPIVTYIFMFRSIVRYRRRRRCRRLSSCFVVVSIFLRLPEFR